RFPQRRPVRPVFPGFLRRAVLSEVRHRFARYGRRDVTTTTFEGQVPIAFPRVDFPRSDFGSVRWLIYRPSSRFVDWDSEIVKNPPGLRTAIRIRILKHGAA